LIFQGIEKGRQKASEWRITKYLKKTLEAGIMWEAVENLFYKRRDFHRVMQNKSSRSPL